MSGTRKKAWTYLKCFLLALAIEVFALASLLPGLAEIGTRHTANAPPSDTVLLSEKVGFILGGDRVRPAILAMRKRI